MAKQKSIKWTPEHYARALKGDPGGAPGLRSLARGFTPADRYDLRHIDEWTPAMRRRVRETYNAVRQLEGQEKYPARPRSKKTLKTLQAAFHGDVKIPALKVALIPYTAPKALPGAKRPPPKVKIARDGGVSIQTDIYTRRFTPFNPLALIEDTAAEVKRAVAATPTAKIFFIKTGEFQTLNARGPTSMLAKVRQWMAQYDGKTALPATRGRKDNRPERHAWWDWLHGVYAIVPGKRVSENKAMQLISEGMKRNKERNADRDKAMRKGRKKSRK